ncbi:MAG: hypothetical protein CFH06_00443 [Alphaproteobacteria bacterium MarineAlpha3_Bin5]|nr:GYD domain-containing protein [Magnetovibrio sp.]PPR79287.1 MAG: hypothetical protein CFH06_00443 [Alphaproteobacteria bacterium MarineAlpha3_Bin5]
MTMYLHQANYSLTSMKGLVSNPQNRKEIVSKAFEAAGGRLIDAWMAFGEYDVVVISEFPSDVDAAALAMSIGSSGSLTNLKTTVLISMDDAVRAMKKAADITGAYTPPS